MEDRAGEDEVLCRRWARRGCRSRGRRVRSREPGRRGLRRRERSPGWWWAGRSGEHDLRRVPLLVELRGVLGDAEVVAAEPDGDVACVQVVAHLVVVPDEGGVRAGGVGDGVHGRFPFVCVVRAGARCIDRVELVADAVVVASGVMPSSQGRSVGEQDVCVGGAEAYALHRGLGRPRCPGAPSGSGTGQAGRHGRTSGRAVTGIVVLFGGGLQPSPGRVQVSVRPVRVVPWSAASGVTGTERLFHIRAVLARRVLSTSTLAAGAPQGEAFRRTPASCCGLAPADFGVAGSSAGRAGQPTAAECAPTIS